MATYAGSLVPVDPRRFIDKFMVGDDCWEWQAGHDSDGYGSFRATDRAVGAHRVSYALFVGDIPRGLQLDHLCRNRNCVRPDHLEAVTSGINTLRGDAPSAVAARQMHCPQGHEYTETPAARDHKRICRPCEAARSRANYWRAKAAV